MLIEDFPGVGIIERFCEPQPLGHLADDPPVVLRLARRRQHSPLAGNAPLGVGDRAILFRPTRRGQHDIGKGQQVGVGHTLRNDDQRALGQGATHLFAIRQAHCRVGGHDPQRRDFATLDGLEQLHRLVARPVRQRG